MSTGPQPLTSLPPAEVPLPNAPLVRVICQVRFPPILAIRNPDRTSVFQEMLRGAYPILKQDRTQNVNLAAALIWRLTSSREDPYWRVSLGVDFVALETTAYDSRNDFLSRLRSVLCSLETAFHPTDVSRLGLRYIDRLTGNAVERLGELIHPMALGILQPSTDSNTALGAATVHVLTEAHFLAQEGQIQARWGKVPQNTTYDPTALEPVDEISWVLDLDMFTAEPQPFSQDALLDRTESFAERIYAVFRQIVNDAFLMYYGAQRCPH
jgi:uncharacterized protein (TIGR04255 family)